jgi:hypothetical protein
MRIRGTHLVLAALLIAGVALAAIASEEAQSVTLTGKVVCAKCFLKKADATKCQNVLVVKGEGEAPTEYYLVKNEVAEKYGHVCQGEKGAVVTGTLEEKEGKTWLTASKMEKPAE